MKLVIVTAVEEFQKDVGFTQFIPIEKADEKTLAKLGNFISQSLISQSLSLGTGGPSQSLAF